MKDTVHFCVTIDTEGDAAVNPNSTYLGIHAVLPRLIEIFDKFGVKATFFIQEDKICQAGSLFMNTWKELEKKGHEIGYHAHGIIPSSTEEKDKIITQGISKLRNAGLNIVSYRAGRFHLTGPLLQILEKNKIKFDSSVVPGLREIFEDGTERCNHIEAPTTPYFPSHQDHTKEGDSPILELPINRYPKFPPDKWGGILIGGSNEEILFDYFHDVRKDKLIIMLLHSWDSLSYIIRGSVRGYHYGKTKKWAFDALRRLLSPERLTNRTPLRWLEKTFQYITEKNDVRFVTIQQAGEKWLASKGEIIT